MNSTCEQFGEKYTTLDQLRANLGSQLDSILDSPGLALDSRQKFVSEFRKRLMISNKTEIKLFPGIEDLLATVKNQRLRIGIATLKPTSPEIEVVRHFIL